MTSAEEVIQIDSKLSPHEASFGAGDQATKLWARFYKPREPLAQAEIRCAGMLPHRGGGNDTVDGDNAPITR
jgi:hypothetical protein